MTWWEKIPVVQDRFWVEFRRGYDKRDQELRAVSPSPEDVVYTPGEDSGFYVVQIEQNSYPHGFDDEKRVWINLAAFPDTELDKAEADADDAFRQNRGVYKVRVIHVGGGER